ncbi:MAG TPA: hypothetical protein VMT90_05310 [Dehalococcoidia bacterium]|jgi:hypothetical protein|nr:hypothetical protein [Dehalococcoidia bacterium]
MTDVGARCPDCAPRRKLPQFEVGFVWLLRAVGAAAVVGAAVGALWGAALPNTAGFFTLAIGAGVGYCIGESVSIATNRKIGRQLQVIAAGGAVLAYVMHNIVAGYAIVPSDDLWGGIALIVAIFVGAGRLQI